MIGYASLIRADAARLPLADDSVDLIVTSPPYFGQRDYRDGEESSEGQIGAEPTPGEFLAALWNVTAELARVLKPTGSLFVNLGDKYNGSGGPGTKGVIGSAMRERSGGMTAYRKLEDVPRKSLFGIPWRYAIGCVDALGLTLRAEIVWSKPNGIPESPRDRVVRSHETWFHLTPGPNYYAELDELREPYEAPHARRTLGRMDASRGDSSTPSKAFGPSTMHPLGKLPRSVWTIPVAPMRPPPWAGVEHFASFPQEWPRRLILGWSPPGGCVLDPFAGTGTVPMVARALGRYGIGVDLSADYLRLATWRIWRSGHGRKSELKTYRNAQGRLNLG